jgi:hypothetical protein
MIVGVWAAITVLSAIITAASPPPRSGLYSRSSLNILDLIPVIDTALSTFISIFIVPMLPIGLTLLYYDTRTRYEGLDIASGAWQAGRHPVTWPRRQEAPV